MRPHVSGQLVRPREAPGAVRPGAREWLLPGMSAEVSLEVRALAIDLGAAGPRAPVQYPTKAVDRRRAHALDADRAVRGGR